MESTKEKVTGFSFVKDPHCCPFFSGFLGRFNNFWNFLVCHKVISDSSKTIFIQKTKIHDLNKIHSQGPSVVSENITEGIYQKSVLYSSPDLHEKINPLFFLQRFFFYEEL